MAMAAPVGARSLGLYRKRARALIELTQGGSGYVEHGRVHVSVLYMYMYPPPSMNGAGGACGGT